MLSFAIISYACGNTLPLIRMDCAGFRDECCKHSDDVADAMEGRRGRCQHAPDDGDAQNLEEGCEVVAALHDLAVRVQLVHDEARRHDLEEVEVRQRTASPSWTEVDPKFELLACACLHTPRSRACGRVRVSSPRA